MIFSAQSPSCRRPSRGPWSGSGLVPIISAAAPPTLVPQIRSKLALHALGKGAMMYIDMINDNLDRSTVEVQVLTACGKSQLVMKSVMKDIKFTPKAAAAQ